MTTNSFCLVGSTHLRRLPLTVGRQARSRSVSLNARARLEQIQTVITDSGIHPDTRAGLCRVGIEVVIAESLLIPISDYSCGIHFESHTIARQNVGNTSSLHTSQPPPAVFRPVTGPLFN